MARRAHLVGSLPGDTSGEAMRLAVERLGDDLAYLPDGETGDRRNWVIPMIEGLRKHPDLELVRDGDWSDYDKIPRLRVKPGHRLYGASLDLGIAAAARAAQPDFDAVRGERPLHFQVGIPGDIDLALFSFGPTGPVRHRRPFTEALVAAMHEAVAAYGKDVLFQVEIPAELVLLGRAPARARPAMAAVIARQLAALAQGAPEGAEFGVHLCLGDMNHRALGRVGDADPLVTLSNAIAERWPQGRPLRYVHLPLAAADDPPSEDPAFYAPLSRLALGPGIDVIAGFAHEDQDVSTQFRIRGLIEDALGAPVGISTSCGLGRRTREAGIAALDRTHLLLGDPPA